MGYLDGYQRTFSKRAADLDAGLSRECGLDDALMERDPARDCAGRADSIGDTAAAGGGDTEVAALYHSVMCKP